MSDKSLIQVLIEKAANAHDSNDAMRFAQAALNSANAQNAEYVLKQQTNKESF